MAVVVIGHQVDEVVDPGQARLRTRGGCRAWTGTGNKSGFEGAVTFAGEADQLHG